MNTLRTSYINARVEPKLKASAHETLKKVGLTTSDAITLFLHQVVLHQGLPFEVRVPNAESRAALKEIREPKIRSKLRTAKTSKEMMIAILHEHKKRAG